MMDFRPNTSEQREPDDRINRYRPSHNVRSVPNAEAARDLLSSLERAGIEGAEMIRGRDERLFVRWRT